MTNLPSQSAEQCSSNETIEVLPRELKAKEHESSSNVNRLFTFPVDESTLVVAKAKNDTQSNALNVVLANCKLVTVGRSNTLQVKCNCHLHEKYKCVSKSDTGVQSECNRKSAYFSSQQCKKTTEEVDKQLQPFRKVAQDCKQVDSGEIVVSVEPLLPLIKKQGYINGPQ